MSGSKFLLTFPEISTHPHVFLVRLPSLAEASRNMRRLRVHDHAITITLCFLSVLEEAEQPWAGVRESTVLYYALDRRMKPADASNGVTELVQRRFIAHRATHEDKPPVSYLVPLPDFVRAVTGAPLAS